MKSLVSESDLDFSYFHCCGDEDLFPFRCSACGHLMVFCYECDTLYQDLKDLSVRGRDVNHFDPQRPIFSCPQCRLEFEYYFMRNPNYRVPLVDWQTAGLSHLLKPSPSTGTPK